MKKILLLTCACLLTACGNQQSSVNSSIDASLPVCEQYFQALKKAAAKNEKFKAALLQTLENDKAALKKFGEKEQDASCRESLKRIQKMLNE